MRRLTLVLSCVLLCSCATIRKSALDISLEEVKNAETARKVAINYLGIWSLQSGFARKALGPRIKELDAHVVDAMDELDELAAADPNTIGDRELGESLGLRVRLLCSVIKEALEFYAPDVLDLVPLLF